MSSVIVGARGVEYSHYRGSASDRLVKHPNSDLFAVISGEKIGPAAAMEFQITLAIAVRISHASIHNTHPWIAYQLRVTESARRAPRAHGD